LKELSGMGIKSGDVVGMGIGHDSPVCTVDPVDWETIITARPNVLLQGERPNIDACLSAIQPYCWSPVVTLRSPVLGSLPDFFEGSVVLEDAAAYGLAEQQALLQWLDRGGYRVQLITVTERPLLDLVERGRFIERLFYRLNIVYLDLALAHSEPYVDVVM
jgi:hypothetical protein